MWNQRSWAPPSSWRPPVQAWAALLFGRRRLIDRLGRAGIWIAIAFGTLLALLAFLLAMGGLWLMSIHVGGHEVTCWTF